VKSRTTGRFRKAFQELPRPIQERAQQAYRLLRKNPRHPSLHFKKVHPIEPIYSARITTGYRAVGLLVEDEVIWYWIGSHAEYERLLRA